MQDFRNQVILKIKQADKLFFHHLNGIYYRCRKYTGMNEEVKFLDIIRRTVLNTDDISAILKFSSDSQKWANPHNKNHWHMHLHEQFEMRILFSQNNTTGVDYTKITEICLTPPQLPHEGLAPVNLRRHLSLHNSADEIYYLRGTSNVVTFALNHDTNVPGVNYSELITALSDCRSYNHDPDHTRILIGLLLSSLRWLLADEKIYDISPAHIIANCIRSHYYRSDLSIREIAEMTNFSPNYIQKVFRAGWGCAPIEYLNEVRLNAARQLLRQHRWQIKEVAAMCGWNYAHYFCRRYKEHFGILPSDE